MFRSRHISLAIVFQTFNILQQCSRILSLTIDNRLTLATNDCYTRISIGSKFLDVDIVLRTDVISLTECEDNCSKYKNDCNAFSFGVGIKGNSTCLISPQIPTLENLESHSEYDVYAKRRQDSLWCNLDRIHGSFIGESGGIQSTKANELNKKELVKIGDSLLNFVPGSTPTLIPLSLPRNKNDLENYGPLDKHFLSEDGNRKVTDIAGNKNARTSTNRFVCSSTNIHKRSNNDDFTRFTSRDDTLNWNGNWRNWKNSDIINGNGFLSPRVNYDKGYLDVVVKPSIFSNSHTGADRSLIQGFPIPNESEQYYGKLYSNYGSAFGYNENHVSVRQKESSCYEKHETLQMIRKCPVKVISGSKLSKTVLRKTCVAHHLEQCEEFCINETSFSCESFAYRCNVLSTNPTDNCLLSDHSYRDLHFYTDLEPNRDYDSYILMPDTKICYLRKSTNRYPSEECFSRIRSGFTMPMDITKKAMFVNDLGECQFACTASQEFLCKSFVFKYALDNHSTRRHGNERVVSSNCFLTDWPSEEINPIDMPDMDGAELYERNTLSYGCETYPSSLPIPNAITSNNVKGPPPMHTDQLCYSEYHKPCRLMSHAIVSSMRAVTKSDCRRKCSTMRNTGAIPSCMSFNYITDTDNAQNNCFLSDISIRDLRPNLDYVHDSDHRLYTWKEFDPYCSSNTQTNTQANNRANTQATQRITDSETGILVSPFYSPVIRWKNKFRFDDEEHDRKHKFVNGDNESLLNADHFEQGLNFPYPGQRSPSRRYTVNGYPCKNGTVCQRNEITGFWSCEIENEHGNWDYCCEPGHHCGFSQGYHYPWCYVGSNEDQWRPCSETYFPYSFTKDHSTYRQLPLHAARHWPVIYLHEISPPNCSSNDHFNIKNS